GLAGCEGLLDVELPGQLVEEDVFTEDNALLLVNSAVGDFECAYSMMSAVLTTAGEETWAGTGGWVTSHADYQTQRPVSGYCADNDNVGESWWHGFERARFFAEGAYERLES